MSGSRRCSRRRRVRRWRTSARRRGRGALPRCRGWLSAGSTRRRRRPAEATIESDPVDDAALRDHDRLVRAAGNRDEAKHAVEVRPGGASARAGSRSQPGRGRRNRVDGAACRTPSGSEPWAWERRFFRRHTHAIRHITSAITADHGLLKAFVRRSPEVELVRRSERRRSRR